MDAPTLLISTQVCCTKPFTNVFALLSTQRPLNEDRRNFRHASSMPFCHQDNYCIALPILMFAFAKLVRRLLIPCSSLVQIFVLKVPYIISLRFLSTEPSLSQLRSPSLTIDEVVFV